MAEHSDVDYNFMDDDNRTDLHFYAYDHPVWKKHEIQLSTPCLPRNTTLAPTPDIFELKHKYFVFAPLFFIIGCIMISGILCNISVCYIYRCRPRRAASNFFVIFFAVYDLFGCLVGIPLEVSSLTLPLMHNVVPLCKVVGCVKSWLVCCQCFMLLCVAFDCYKKICQPERDLTIQKAKVCCFFAVVVAMLMSLPALAVFGTQPVRNSYTGIFGVNCSVDSSEAGWLRILHYICMLGTFIVSTGAMGVLYGLIYVTWYKQRQREETGENQSPVKREFPKKHRFVRQDTSESCVVNYCGDVCRIQENPRSFHCSFLAHSDLGYHQLKSTREPKTNKKSSGEVKTRFNSSRDNNSNSKSSSAFKPGRESNSGDKLSKQSNSGSTPSNKRNSGNKSNNVSNNGKIPSNQRNSGNTPSNQRHSENKSNNPSNSGSTRNSQRNSGIKSGNHSNSGGHKTNDQSNIGSSANILSNQPGKSCIQLHLKNNQHVLIFTVISVLFLINMLPFVAVTILYATTNVFSSFSSTTSEIMFHFCACSYLFNYLVKPLTYVFLNVNFRKELKNTFNKFKMSLRQRDAPYVGTSCKKLQRLSAVGPLRSTLPYTVYRPHGSPS